MNLKKLALCLRLSFGNFVFCSYFPTFFILEIGPVTITTDPKKFQFELRELYVQVSNLFILCMVLAKALFPPSNLSSCVDISATMLC